MLHPELITQGHINQRTLVSVMSCTYFTLASNQELKVLSFMSACLVPQ